MCLKSFDRLPNYKDLTAMDLASGRVNNALVYRAGVAPKGGNPATGNRLEEVRHPTVVMNSFV